MVGEEEGREGKLPVLCENVVGREKGALQVDKNIKNSSKSCTPITKI
jgi:hypothetical protein